MRELERETFCFSAEGEIPMPGTQITLRSIVLDCPDAWALAGFYSALLG